MARFVLRGPVFPRSVNNRNEVLEVVDGSCRDSSWDSARSPTRDTYTLCWNWIREFMSRRQILSGFGGKHRAPTRARKSTSGVERGPYLDCVRVSGTRVRAEDL